MAARVIPSATAQGAIALAGDGTGAGGSVVVVLGNSDGGFTGPLGVSGCAPQASIAPHAIVLIFLRHRPSRS